MNRPLFTAVTLAAVSIVSVAQSQPVTGTILRPEPSTAAKSAQAATPSASPVQAKRSRPVIEISERTSKLQVGSETCEFRRRVHQIRGQKGLQDSTTEWWEIRDSAGKVVVHKDFGAPKLSQFGDFEESEQVSATEFHADGGDGILVEGSALPSAPRGGTWVQLFGRPWGPKLQPLQAFGPPISTDGEFTGIAVDHRRDPPKPPGPGITIITLHDVMKFTIWTGNFDIEYLALINWMSGRIDPAMRCLRTTMKGQVERCQYPIHAEARRDTKNLTFVRMFFEAEEIGTPEHVVIKPDSRIEYITAEVPVSWQVDPEHVYISAQTEDGEMWLKVRIDGKEGWIHTEEDLLAVGLPQSG